MKVLIWFLCFFANGMVTILIQKNGVRLGAIPTMILCGITFWLAKGLCKKWDEHKKKKAAEQKVLTQPLQPTATNTADQAQFCRECGEKLIDNSLFCRKCGSEIIKEQNDDAQQKQQEPPSASTSRAKRKLDHMPLYHVISIILSVLSIVSIVIAMNVQDTARNSRESLNPTILYFVLIGVNIAFSAALLLLKKHFISKCFIALAPALFSIITLMEGSLFSNKYGYHNYLNSELVNTFNAIWVSLSFVIFLMNLTPLSLALRSKWHHTMRYRERCYKRVEKMKTYLDKKIITEEEFEKNKQEILKNVKV